jgi:hypothetical protein
MRPKILLRTHYQAAEPRVLIATITDCTSPTEGRDEDSVAAALVRWARDVNYVMSLPGAVSAVGNDRALGFLNNSNRWTSAGLALVYCRLETTSDQRIWIPELSPAEQRIFLKYYIANAGALLVKFGGWLLGRTTATDDQLRNDSIIEKLVVEVLDEYLALATDIRDRTAIRQERDRLARSHYAAITKRHKRYPLLTVMRRLKLLDSEAEQSAGIIAPDEPGRLASLVKAVPDVSTLERLDRLGNLDRTVAKVLATNERAGSTRMPGEVLVSAYQFAIQKGLQACPLEFLDNALMAFCALGSSDQLGEISAEAWFEPLHLKFPGDVRFHVDRRGRRAFVLATERALTELAAAS